MSALSEYTNADALEVGKAAEHLVCADLILAGHRAFLSDQGLPYDVLVDAEGRFVRVQVKASIKARNYNAKGRAPNMIYGFAVRSRGKGRKGERLSAAHCDVVALVALDIKVIAYFPIDEVGQTMGLFPPSHDFAGRYTRARYTSIDRYPFDEALAKCRWKKALSQS